jgi:hypothetical protein
MRELFNMSKKKKFTLAAIICIIFLIFFIWWAIYISANNWVDRPEKCFPSICFNENFENKTLTLAVAEGCGLTKSDFVWENIEIKGNGTKPTGEMQPGNIITNCSGEVSIIWIPSTTVVYKDTFPE